MTPNGPGRRWCRRHAQSLPVPPPEDAVVLFDGTGLDGWKSEDGGTPAQWRVQDGAMISVPESGYLYTSQAFGDVQLHVEWAAPLPVEGSSQGRGNSGVYLMSKYEVQVLDSYQNDTYPDGQAGAVYGQYPPLVNASLPPGEWQTYDIVFRRPRFHRDGRLASPARMTVFHNGILVQDNVELWGPTGWLQHAPYTYHPDRAAPCPAGPRQPGPVRNIWLRELPEHAEAGPVRKPAPPAISLAPAVLQRYAGRYRTPDGNEYVISLHGDHLRAFFYRQPEIELVPRSERGVRPALDGGPPAVRPGWGRPPHRFHLRDRGATGVRSSGLTDLGSTLVAMSLQPIDDSCQVQLVITDALVEGIENRTQEIGAQFIEGCQNLVLRLGWTIGTRRGTVARVAQFPIARTFPNER